MKSVKIKKERRKEYYRKNAKKIKEKSKKYYQENLEKCKEYARKQSKEFYKRCRKIVLDHYGRKCICCSETIEQFLEVDHRSNDGTKRYKESGRPKCGGAFYSWIIKNNFPADLQILCSNCNQGKRRNNGICPHTVKHEDGIYR